MDPFILFLDVCHTRRRYEEKRFKNFGLLRIAFFEKFVSIDLLGPKEFILSFAQYLSKYLVDPDKLLPDICHVQ